MLSYNSALKEADVRSPHDRRASLSLDLFNDIVLDSNQKLAGLLPAKADHHRQLRNERKFNVPAILGDPGGRLLGHEELEAAKFTRTKEELLFRSCKLGRFDFLVTHLSAPGSPRMRASVQNGAP